MFFLKSLKNKIPIQIQWIVMIILFMFSMIGIITDEYGFNIVIAVLPRLLIGLAVIYLFSEKKLLGGYIVLLVALFGRYIYNFVSFVLSFRLNTLNFLQDITLLDVIGTVFSIYLLLMILSYVLNEEKQNINIHMDLLVILLSLYLYFRYGYEYAFVALFLMLVFIALNSKVGLYLMMLSYVIHIPFFLIDLVFDRIGFNLLSYWVYGWFGFILMIWISIYLVKALNQEIA
ncbi:hypothetical protein [Mariniplasma anaerobium]|uniref:Uncharacterized protein n=1 Tax=Mariniplasma anaerobium TaxID=2735436 RepID=A0A7U9TGW7_9MOLU|nr:hypothetical protein [Mariniplasma anaerobium]BCR36393.1 hypothetical protein MPAN_012860 [Mariniplasma anaerobium]